MKMGWVGIIGVLFLWQRLEGTMRFTNFQPAAFVIGQTNLEAEDFVPSAGTTPSPGGIKFQ